MIVTLLGGLVIFIYGMNLMSDGLQKAAGEKMKNILALLTKNPVVGVLAGGLTTAVLQSSSATTVMAIGFVSAGLMTLPQAISIILGANIGTTITAQLIAFQIGDYAWTFVVIGFIMYFFIKKENIVNIGQTIFGFGMLFIGINTTRGSSGICEYNDERKRHPGARSSHRSREYGGSAEQFGSNRSNTKSCF